MKLVPLCVRLKNFLSCSLKWYVAITFLPNIYAVYHIICNHPVHNVQSKILTHVMSQMYDT
jgi:hypothetical protein